MDSAKKRSYRGLREPGIMSRLGEFGELARARSLPLQRLFEDYIGDIPEMFSESGRRNFIPRTNISETEDAFRLSVELPGMTEDDIDISLTSDGLLIQGEKREEHEEENQGLKYVESSYGRFERLIPVTQEVEEDKITASFDKGILRLELPKTEKAKSRGKKIKIRSSSSSEIESRQKRNGKSRLSEKTKTRKTSSSEGAQSASQ